MPLACIAISLAHSSYLNGCCISSTQNKKIYQSKMSSTVFGRGAHTMNSLFFKPVIGRKSYHKKGSSSADKPEGMKVEGEEVKEKRQSRLGGDNIINNNYNDNSLWVPHEGTGIYYPKGNEKVMQDVPPKAAKDMSVHWFSH